MREVRHDGAGALQVRFSYDRELVDLIRTLPHRRWDAGERFWEIPHTDVVLLIDLLHPGRFRFDAATRACYRELGGTQTLPESTEATAVSRMPGPFDDPVANDEGSPQIGGNEDYTVSRLNGEVQRVIEEAFPRPVWLVGEISSFNRNAHKRHVSFQLAEKGDDGRTVSSIDATLFEKTRRSIERTLASAGEPFRLEDEITVRMRVRIELYVPWGSYRVIVDDLDVNFTLGEAARRREEIIRRLTEAGLVAQNTAIPMPALPLRVGLITSLGSDAYKDVVQSLRESGFAFRLTAHGARVQGHSTEPSVLNALDELRRRVDDLDVVLVCRGGGSRTDLAWFDSEALGRAVAEFPLPVIVGIGHEQDQSVLDAVGRRCKTPTAAASLLVEAVRESLDNIETLSATLLELAVQRIRDEIQRGTQWGRRVGLAARGLLDRERISFDHRSERTVRGARTLLNSASDRLLRWVRDIPRAGSVHFARQQSFLDAARRSMSQAARRDIVAAGHGLDGWARVLRPRAAAVLARETERTDARDRRLHLVDPRRVLERGYAVLRMEGQGVVSDAGMAPAGTVLHAELKRGSLALRSEGAADDRGGD